MASTYKTVKTIDKNISQKLRLSNTLCVNDYSFVLDRSLNTDTDCVYSKADLHIHSTYSDGRDSPDEIVDAALGKVQVIAITDHNEIKGAFKAKEYALKHRIKLDVVIGEEISTKNGHIIGLFLKDKIIPGKTAMDTIEEIHKQEGLAVAPHPFSFIKFNAMGYDPINKILKDLDLDAIEIINCDSIFSIIQNAVEGINNNNNFLIGENPNTFIRFAQLGVSDAHSKAFIGKGYTLFAGTSAANLKIQIKNKDTTAHFNFYSMSELSFNILNKFNSLYSYLFNKKPKD